MAIDSHMHINSIVLENVKISDYINEKQIKILSLAKYCDIDRSTMYKVMNGKRNPPSQETLKKMAHFMHLTPVEHQKFQVFGVQFHPESVMTPDGRKMLGRLPE